MSTALIVVDVQNDFCEGGALAVAGGGEVAAGVTGVVAANDPAAPDGYAHVVATQDYHVDPGGHFSAEPNYVDTWPPHCVVSTDGWHFHPAFDPAGVEATFRKGAYTAAYSGFEGATEDGTGLTDWLRAHDVDRVDVVGIATDHCVRATALDAVRAGFATRVRLDLTAGVARDTTDRALVELAKAGVDLTGEPKVG